VICCDAGDSHPLYGSLERLPESLTGFPWGDGLRKKK
jgi:hypothetical protein